MERSVPFLELVVLTHPEAARGLGAGIQFVRGLLERGEIEIVGIGGDERIPTDELERWILAADLERWCEEVAEYDECPSASDTTALPTPGGRVSASTASATRSRSARRTSEPPRPWNGTPVDAQKLARGELRTVLPLVPRSLATGRSTDDS
jgi:excisionase family DNA binding protein